MLRVRRRQWLGRARTPLALAACLLGYYAVPYGRHGWSVHGYTGVLLFAAGAAVLGGLIVRQVAAQLGAGGRETDLEGLFLALCLLVIAFSLVYLKMADQFDGLQTKTDALYFTMATLATVGYGDIHPVGQTARLIVTGQMAIDLIYVAAVISVVSGLLGERAREKRGIHPE